MESEIEEDNHSESKIELIGKLNLVFDRVGDSNYIEKLKLVLKGVWKLSTDAASVDAPEIQENIFLYQKVGRVTEQTLIESYFSDGEISQRV